MQLKKNNIPAINVVFYVTMVGCYFFSHIISAQNIIVPEIPDSLKKDASAIVLSQNEVINLISIDKVIYDFSNQTLILKENETNHQNKIYIFHDNFRKLDKIKLSIHDLTGQKIKEIPKKDFNDIAYTDGFSVANDSRYLYYEVQNFKPPYILNITYQANITSTYSLPSFRLYDGEDIAVLEKNYKIIHTDYNNPLIISSDSLFNLNDTITELGRILICKQKNTTSTEAKKVKERVLKVYPENFSMDGFKGNRKNWKELGNWFFDLIKSAGALDEKTIAQIRTLTANQNDPHEKLEILYRFLQQNMRYVSIQLGIGGLKPMAPQQVHTNKYGDCKALSYYMQQLLKAAEIESKYIVVLAGDKTVEPDPVITEDVFNHIILCAFIEKDTIFLECTSKESPPGYLGSFTSNRYVLMVDEHNSQLIKTPHYDKNVNIKTNNFHVKPEENLVTHKSERKGIATEINGLNFKIDQNNIDFQKYWNDINADISEIVIKNKKSTVEDKIPICSFELMFYANKKIVKSGKRYLIETNFEKIDLSDFIVKNNKKNYTEIVSGLATVDTINVDLKENCKPEKLPKDLNLKLDFGEINHSTVKTEDSISFVRSLKFDLHVIPKENVDKWNQFMEQIAKSYREKIVIVCDQ